MGSQSDIIEIDNDIKSYEQQLDNLDKPQVYQIVNLVANPYILKQFNNSKPNIDSQAQYIPNIKVQKNQLNKISEVDTGNQNCSNELQNQDIQTPQNQSKPQVDDQQQNQSSQSFQNQQQVSQEGIQNPQNQSQEEHEQQNQSIEIPQVQKPKSQEDLEQNDQSIYNHQNQQPKSEEQNRSIQHPQNQQLKYQEDHKFQDQNTQYPQNKYLKSQENYEKQYKDIQSSQNQQQKSQEGHKQQYYDSQNPQNQQQNPQKNHNQQSQSIQNTNPQQISQQFQKQQNQCINSNNQNKQTQEIQKKVSPIQNDQILKQDLTMKTIDKQQQKEVQYYVYEDLKNFLGILTDVTETLKFFDGTQDAAYVPVAINRLVLQYTISNGIHFDCQHNFQSDYQKQLYQQEKQNALKILKESVEKMQIPKHHKIYECINRYEQTLGKNTELKTIEPLKVEHKNKDEKQFQETVTKIIGGMQQVDKQLQDVNKGIYQKPEKEDLQKNLNERKLIAQQKLAQVYPQVAKQNTQKINQNKQKLFEDYK